MPQCHVCGSPVPEQTQVCPNCGTQMPGAAPPPAVPSPPPGAAPTPSSAPTGVARVILKRSGALTSESFPLAARGVLGRFDPDTGPVDIDLGALPEAVYVSRRHAEMWRDTAGQWFIKDLGAGNGTFMRAQGQTQFQRVTGAQPIADGDEIALGNASFEFRVS